MYCLLVQIIPYAIHLWINILILMTIMITTILTFDFGENMNPPYVHLDSVSKQLEDTKCERQVHTYKFCRISQNNVGINEVDMGFVLNELTTVSLMQTWKT